MLLIILLSTLTIVFFLMIRRPPRSTRTDTLLPYTTLFRSGRGGRGPDYPRKTPMASRADQLASNLNFSKFGQPTELQNRIWFTIGALIVFRFLSFVPLPGVDPVALASLSRQAASGGVLDLFNTLPGRSEQRRGGKEWF